MRMMRIENTNNWANQVSPGYDVSHSHMVAHPPNPQPQSRQIHVNSTIDADIGELVLWQYLLISMMCV